MTRKQVKAEIDRQYAILERECNGNIRADRLLFDAYRFACEGEKQHRQAGSFARIRPKQSVETAAKYHVLQGFRDPVEVCSILHASSLRLDVLYSSALRTWLDEQHSQSCTGISAAGAVLRLVGSYSIEKLDYARDIG